MHRNNISLPRRRPIAVAVLTIIALALTMLTTHHIASAQPAQAACPQGSYNPTPTAVTVDTVPIVVDSTDQEYFVLYASHDLEDGTEMELPVLVKKGQTGTTTLAENVPALPKENYRVEKYLISDPADVDDDCTDDITELDDTTSKNPLNSADSLDIEDGAIAIPDQDTLQALSRSFGTQSYLKFVIIGIDTPRPALYFMNSNTYPHHRVFLTDVLDADPADTSVVRGLIGYAPESTDPDGDLGLYYYSSEQRRYSFSTMERTYIMMAASIPLVEDNLAYWIPSEALREHQENLPLYRDSRIPLVFDDDIYPDIDFLALNPEEGYGLLKVMDADDRPPPRSVVIYESLPNELPRVAGIISTVPQTPLSHVNLRAMQDGVPNSYIRNALEDDTIDSLIDGYVHYQVTSTGWSMEAATESEVNAHHAALRPATTTTPQRDLSVKTINPLSDVSFNDWDSFGVKAANVAVLRTLGFPTGTVPDGFAIPFHFYDEFMKHNGFYTRVDTMLANADFQSDLEEQETQLKALRKDIEDADTPDWILTALADMNTKFPQGTTNRKYRSSTNNEDLPGFNGAGLYDSKSQKPDEDDEDGLDKSLKEVYASLWNFRAFTERDFHRIDHMKAAMGILVHPSYQDELVNGVAVSFDPVTAREGWYYVNSQVGEDLVTNPDALSVPEELLLGPYGSNIVLSASNQAQPGQLLINRTQLRQLREHLEEIHDHFKELYNPGAGESFAMEIEFKITSDSILAIKQARPWVFSDATVEPAHYRPLLSASDAQATEGGNAEFTVSISQSTTAPVTVQYNTADGTATSSDYTPVSGQTLTFAAGETEKTVSIATTDDSDQEVDEHFQLSLSNPSANADIASISTATATILDNDQPALSDDATLSALALADPGSTQVALNPSVRIRNHGLHCVRRQQRWFHHDHPGKEPHPGPSHGHRRQFHHTRYGHGRPGSRR